jgi:hypothetical protein
VHFYRQRSVRMDWKQKLLNLLRIVGAPLVGYRSRHLPEQAYQWVADTINKIFFKAKPPRRSGVFVESRFKRGR